MPRSKAKKTGSRTRGRGHKKGRGAGLRGGRGNAGSHKTKRVMYERVGRIWGRYGFKRPQSTVKASRVTNIREIEENLEMMIKEGIVKKKGDVIEIEKNLYDKFKNSKHKSHKHFLFVNICILYNIVSYIYSII